MYREGGGLPCAHPYTGDDDGERRPHRLAWPFKDGFERVSTRFSTEQLDDQPSNPEDQGRSFQDQAPVLPLVGDDFTSFRISQGKPDAAEGEGVCVQTISLADTVSHYRYISAACSIKLGSPSDPGAWPATSRVFKQSSHTEARAGVAELAKGAGLKIPSVEVRGFESHPPHMSAVGQKCI